MIISGVEVELPLEKDEMIYSRPNLQSWLTVCCVSPPPFASSSSSSVFITLRIWIPPCLFAWHLCCRSQYSIQITRRKMTCRHSLSDSYPRNETPPRSCWICHIWLCRTWIAVCVCRKRRLQTADCAGCVSGGVTVTACGNSEENKALLVWICMFMSGNWCHWKAVRGQRWCKTCF